MILSVNSVGDSCIPAFLHSLEIGSILTSTTYDVIAYSASPECFHYLLVTWVAADWIQLRIVLGPVHLFVTEVRKTSLE